MSVKSGCVFFCEQKPAYEMRISDWSSDVSSSDLSSIACITLRTISRSASGSCASNSLTADTAGLISVLVMAGLLGDVEHHQPAMTASLLKRFCRTSRTLPIIEQRGRGADSYPLMPSACRD